MDIANGQDAAPAAASDGRAARDRAARDQALPPDPAASHEPGAPDAGADAGHDTGSRDTDNGVGIADPRPSKRRVGVLVAVALTVYALDIASKTLVAAMMHYGQPIRLLGPALSLDYTRNPGAAFSIGEAYTIIFTAIAVGVIAVILRLSRKLFSLPWAIALGLLLGGALGNLTDRLTRAPGFLRGWVVDFIHLPHWPIFNLADSAICVGGALMVLLAFRGLHPDGTDERAAADQSASGRNASDRDAR